MAGALPGTRATPTPEGLNSNGNGNSNGNSNRAARLDTGAVGAVSASDRRPAPLLESPRQVTRLGRTVLFSRMIALGLVALTLPTRPERLALTLPALIVAVVLVAMYDRHWERLFPAMSRHPAILGADVVVAIVLLAACGAHSPMLFHALGAAYLSGLVLRRQGAMVFSATLLAGYFAALARPGDASQSWEFVIIVAGLFPVAAALGVSFRGSIEAAEEAAEVRRLAERAAATADERERLAREMHDSVVKSLHGLQMSTAAARAVSHRDPGRAEEKLAELTDSIGIASAEARSLMTLFRVERPDRPLPESLGELAAAWSERSGVAVVCDLSGLGPLAGLDVEGRHEVMAVVGEALENVQRHAAASHVWIRGVGVGGHIVIEVTDDGRGIGPADLAAAPRRGSYGVAGMRERAMRLGGQLDVGCRPGGGTSLRLAVPCADRVSGPVPTPAPTFRASPAPIADTFPRLGRRAAAPDGAATRRGA